MTSSASSTDAPRASRDGLQPWQIYLLVAMAGATWAVIVARQTTLVSLLLLSAAILSAGVAAAALHTAITGFLAGGQAGFAAPLSDRARAALEREKSLVLRSLKELEFDHAMGKVSAADFADISGRLRARAIELMRDLDRAPAPAHEDAKAAPAGRRCRACEAANDVDARFCKACGAKL